MDVNTELKLIGYSHEQKRWLYILLLGSGLIMLLPFYWVNREVHSTLGLDALNAVLSFHWILLFFLIAIGFTLALGIDLMIRCRLLIFRGNSPGKWVEKIWYLWGYGIIVDVLEEDQDVPIVTQDQPGKVIKRKLKRRGRSPAFPIDRWAPIVEKWENRDPLRDIFSIEDLIGEYLGTNPDGSPIVTKQSYYRWRDKVLAEYAKEEKNG